MFWDFHTWAAKHLERALEELAWQERLLTHNILFLLTLFSLLLNRSVTFVRSLCTLSFYNPE